MGARDGFRRWLRRHPHLHAFVRLVVETWSVCLRYRVTGLASEAAFFMLLSLPPLMLGVFAGIGFVGSRLEPGTVQHLTDVIVRFAGQFLTEDSVRTHVLPTINDVLGNGRADLVSVGFLLSLWSGSRALNVFIDTVSIMYGQSGVRGIIGTRVLSLSLYAATIVTAGLVLPLLLVGPHVLRQWVPEQLEWLVSGYWPFVIIVSVVGITTLYNIATPRRARWWRDMPGAVLAIALWLAISIVVRTWLEASIGGSSIYGPLSTPIVLLIWAYLLAIAILIGAGLNAATRSLWPVPDLPPTHTRLLEWASSNVATLRARATALRERGGAGELEDLDDDAALAWGAVLDEHVAQEKQFSHRERSALAQAIEAELLRMADLGPPTPAPASTARPAESGDEARDGSRRAGGTSG